MEVEIPMKIHDQLTHKGHLQIIKDYGDREEIAFEDHNIIVSGMGASLSHLFLSDGSQHFKDFKIDSFQIGVSGGENAHVVTTNELSGALASMAEYYGPAYFKDNLLLGTEQANELIKTDQVFGKISESKIKKINFAPEVSGPAVMFTIILDEYSANEIVRDNKKVPLNEIGLFMKNPHFNTPYYPTGIPYTENIMYNEGNIPSRGLVAYRYFSDILKDSSFILIFKWIIYIGA